MGPSKMFSSKGIILIFMLCAVRMAWAAGTPVTEQDIAPWNLDIDPLGRGLPNGHGTANEGAIVYETHCKSCHGKGGKSGHADELVGGIGSLATPNAERTVGSFWPYATTLFDYVRRAMPWGHPSTLTTDQIYAVCAWILAENGIISRDSEMNAISLPQVNMPNKNGFYVRPGTRP